MSAKRVIESPLRGRFADRQAVVGGPGHDHQCHTDRGQARQQIGGLPRELAFQQLGKLIMLHVCQSGHPLAQLDTVTFDDQHAHRRLAFSAHASKLPRSEYLRSTQLWQAESYLALFEMVRAVLDWTTLPRQLIKRELAKGELVEFMKEVLSTEREWV